MRFTILYVPVPNLKTELLPCYKAIVVPDISFHCETLSLTVYEEHRGCFRTNCWGEYLGL